VCGTGAVFCFRVQEATMKSWIDVRQARIPFYAIGILISLVFPDTSQAAPKELLGKSISWRTMATRVIQGADGRVVLTQNASGEGLIYVSTLGRVFLRGHNVGTRGIVNESREQSPDQHLTGGDWHVAGDSLVKTSTRAGTTCVNTISFDPSFKTCHMSVRCKTPGAIYSAGGMPWRVLRDWQYESETCSIQEGNAFAN